MHAITPCKPAEIFPTQMIVEADVCILREEFCWGLKSSIVPVQHMMRQNTNIIIKKKWINFVLILCSL